jgi:hypothetical protein
MLIILIWGWAICGAPSSSDQYWISCGLLVYLSWDWPPAEGRSPWDIREGRVELSELWELFARWCCTLHQVQTPDVTCTSQSFGSPPAAGCGSSSLAASPPSPLKNKTKVTCCYHTVLENSNKIACCYHTVRENSNKIACCYHTVSEKKEKYGQLLP